MATQNVGNTKIFTIPANEETTLDFGTEIQHISFLNESNTTLFFRADGLPAAIDDVECNKTDPTVGVTGFADLYFSRLTRTISFISANETVIQIYNVY